MKGPVNKAPPKINLQCTDKEREHQRSNIHQYWRGPPQERRINSNMRTARFIFFCNRDPVFLSTRWPLIVNRKIYGLLVGIETVDKAQFSYQTELLSSYKPRLVVLLRRGGGGGRRPQRHKILLVSFLMAKCHIGNRDEDYNMKRKWCNRWWTLRVKTAASDVLKRSEHRSHLCNNFLLLASLAKQWAARCSRP